MLIIFVNIDQLPMCSWFNHFLADYDWLLNQKCCHFSIVNEEELFRRLFLFRQVKLLPGTSTFHTSSLPFMSRLF